MNHLYVMIPYIEEWISEWSSIFESFENMQHILSFRTLASTLDMLLDPHWYKLNHTLLFHQTDPQDPPRLIGPS